MNTVQSSITADISLRCGFERQKRHDVPVTVIAICKFAELMERTKLIIGIGTYETVIITATHDGECPCDAVIATVRDMEGLASRNQLNDRYTDSTLSIAEQYSRLVATAFARSSTDRITIGERDRLRISDLAAQLMSAASNRASTYEWIPND